MRKHCACCPLKRLEAYEKSMDTEKLLEDARAAFSEDIGYLITIMEDAVKVVAQLDWFQEEYGVSRAEAIVLASKYSDIGFRTHKRNRERKKQEQENDSKASRPAVA